jgi:hypothetical protein
MTKWKDDVIELNIDMKASADAIEQALEKSYASFR